MQHAPMKEAPWWKSNNKFTVLFPVVNNWFDSDTKGKGFQQFALFASISHYWNSSSIPLRLFSLLSSSTGAAIAQMKYSTHSPFTLRPAKAPQRLIVYLSCIKACLQGTCYYLMVEPGSSIDQRDIPQVIFRNS